jgi:Ca2+-binding RTX toxin-like protein
MPVLFARPPLPTSPAVAGDRSLQDSLTITVGESYFYTGASALFRFSDSTSANLVNGGTLWANNSAAVIDVYNLGAVTNTGSIVASSDVGQTRAIRVASSFQGLTNSGTVIAYAGVSGAALALEYFSRSPIVNSGTVASFSAAGIAYAIDAANGGIVRNLAGGVILAEGNNALAVFSGRGSFHLDGGPVATDVFNAGRIEALATGPNNASVAIYASIAAGETYRIDNSGVIRGTYAVYASSDGFSPTPHATEQVINRSSGLIEGIVDLGLGNDRIENACTINGFVDLGGDDDVVDTIAGRINGVVDLGSGADSFFGSGFGDVAGGDRGNDRLEGNAGADLLIGGRGDDVLIGGAGNDGLYGDFGDDTLISSGGDVVDGGGGNDRIVLGDLGFARVTGGAGIDTLVLPDAATRLDLSAVVASGRVGGIERIELPGAQEIIVRQGDAAALAGPGGLTITGAATAIVDLVGGWAEAANMLIDGANYRQFTLGSEQLLVAAQVQIAVRTTAPAAATGLDPIAAGPAAPLPGTIAGAGLASSSTAASLYTVDQLLVIDADERWSTSQEFALLQVNDYRVINRGVIHAEGNANGARAIAGYFDVVNSGEISVNSPGDPARLAELTSYLQTYLAFRTLENSTVSALASGSSGRLDNSGLVSARAGAATAVAINSYGIDLRNSGDIVAASTQFNAGAIYAYNGGSIVNAGRIEATGANGAYGIYSVTHPIVIDNAGTIAATATTPGGEAIAIANYYADGISRITNSGTITATVAIQNSTTVNAGTIQLFNSGTINGRIESNVQSVDQRGLNDIVFNTGTINGELRLGFGADIYYAIDGHQNGVIYGEAGNDVLYGSRDNDRIEGGAGNDLIVGGSGADILIGGDGRNVFAYLAIGDSTPLQRDTIQGFVTGFDRLDLTRLGLSSVSLTVSNGSTIVAGQMGGQGFAVQIVGTIALSDILLSASGTVTSTVTGTSGNDVLFAPFSGGALLGNAGDDLLIGGPGNDRLTAGEGSSVLQGGSGDDVYELGNSGAIFGLDTVIELPDGGTDTVYARRFTLPDNVENLVLIGTGGTGTGNALANTIIGTSGADTITGGGGGDRLFGGDGNDHYYVSQADDIVFENAGQGIDTVTAGTSYYLYANIENLDFTTFDGAGFYGVGNDLDNRITGTYGSNLLIGGGGNDTLDGDSGNDLLFGEAGDDRLLGGAGIDYLVGGDGDDYLEGSIGADALYGGAGNDFLRGSETTFFDPISAAFRPITDFSTDILVGGAGNDTLDGYTGLGDYDLLDGGAGDDTYLVDTPADLTFEAAGGGLDTVFANIIDAGYYLYAEVENLVLQGTTPFGVGNELDNRLTGSASANWLLGGAGNDVLNGKGGNDVLFGQSGADVFVFDRGSGADVIGDFERGVDQIDIRAFGIASFAQLQSLFVQNGSDGAINLGNGDFVVLNNVTFSQLTTADFLI